MWMYLNLFALSIGILLLFYFFKVVIDKERFLKWAKFWLVMLIDCLKRDFRKDIEKVVWVLVLVFLHLLGALVYYFVVKINDKKIVGKKK